MKVQKWMVVGLVAVVGITAVVSYNRYRSRKRVDELKNQKLKKAQDPATVPSESPIPKPSLSPELIFGLPTAGPINFI